MRETHFKRSKQQQGILLFSSTNSLVSFSNLPSLALFLSFNSRHCRLYSAPPISLAVRFRGTLPLRCLSIAAAGISSMDCHGPAPPLIDRRRVWSEQLQSATISSSSRCPITSRSSPSPSTLSISFSIPTTAPNSPSLSPPPCCCPIVVQDRHRRRIEAAVLNRRYSSSFPSQILSQRRHSCSAAAARSFLLHAFVGYNNLKLQKRFLNGSRFTLYFFSQILNE